MNLQNNYLLNSRLFLIQYLTPNGKPTPPPEEPIDPTDPDRPTIEDPVEPTDPGDPVQEPVKSYNYYDPNNVRNYVRAPERHHVH